MARGLLMSEAQQTALRVCVLSTASAAAPGGLPAYTGGLMRALRSRCALSAAARFGAAPPPRLDYGASDAASVHTWEGLDIPLLTPGRWRGVVRTLPRVLDRRLLQRSATAIGARAYAGALRRAVPDPVDVVHVVGVGRELIGFAGLALARSMNAALTVAPGSHTGQWGDGPLDIRFYRQAGAVIAFTEHEARNLARHGVPARRLHTCGLAPNVGADGDGRRFRARLGLADRPVILFLGRRQRYKGFHALREAMPSVLLAHPDSCLVCIGQPGEPVDVPLPNGAVRVLDAVDEDAKADALAACDVLCVPSEGESFGLAYVEAWVYGKPVVVGPAPAAREVVTDGVDGLWAKNEPRSVARALTRLLDDSDLRRRMGEAGRRRQAERFTWSRVAERHLEIFADARVRR